MSRIVTCIECGKDRPYRAKGVCAKCYRRVYQTMNKETVRAQRKVYRARHSNEIHSYKLRYRFVNRDVLKAKDDAYNSARVYIGFLGKQVYAPNTENPRKGYVWHHTCYDHSDLEANLVLLSRSSHAMGHNVLRKLGIAIPQINIGR